MHDGFEQMLDLLDVRLEAFAMCEIGEGWRLACPPMDRVGVPFVLEGEGILQCEHGTVPLRPGTMVVVPRNLAKNLDGPGAVARTADLSAACPLGGGLTRVRAGGGPPPNPPQDPRRAGGGRPDRRPLRCLPARGGPDEVSRLRRLAGAGARLRRGRGHRRW